MISDSQDVWNLQSGVKSPKKISKPKVLDHTHLENGSGVGGM